MKRQVPAIDIELVDGTMIRRATAQRFDRQRGMLTIRTLTIRRDRRVRTLRSDEVAGWRPTRAVSPLRRIRSAA